MSEHVRNNHLSQKRVTDLPSDVCADVLSLLNITAEDAEECQLRIVDERPEDNVILVHYLEPTEAAKHLRGVIVDVEGMEIVAGCFPHTLEVSPDDLPEDFPVNATTQVRKASEGTVLRVWWGRNTGRMYMSTHRKIRGERSRWGGSGQPFSQILSNVWGQEDWEKYMDKNLCYCFLVSSPPNRLVSYIPDEEVRLIGVFDGGSRVECALLRDHPYIITPESVNCVSREEIVEIARGLKWQQYSGLIVETDGQFIKLVPEDYSSRRLLRGNDPNLRMRYLSMLSDPLRKGKLVDLFLEKKVFFDQVEKDLNRVENFLVGAYNTRYINGRYYELPREEHNTLRRVVRDLGDRKDGESIVKSVRSVMAKCPANILNTMIKHRYGME